MEYSLGTKKDFFSFIENISKKDKTAILTHTDLDGLASGILMEEILKQKKLKCSNVSFLNYKSDMFDESILLLKQKNITKIFVLDLNADEEEKSFEKLRKNFDVFLIDHHPTNENLLNTKNIVKTESADCTTLTLYELGKEIIGEKKFELLVSATAILEWSYKKKENFNFLKEKYPEFEFDKAIESTPGKFAIEIGNAIIYYKGNLKKVYNLIKKNKLKELGAINKTISYEIKKEIEEFGKEVKVSKEKKIYFYMLKSKYDIASSIATIFSKTDKDKSFLVLSDMGEEIKVSARNQGEIDVNKLIRKGIAGIEGAVGGGHACASGARIPKKYLEKFKENILHFA